MRIGAKLLLTYLLLIGLVAVAVGIGLPRWIKSTVVEMEHARLEKQVHSLAERLNRPRVRPGDELNYIRQTFAMVEDFLPDEIIAIVDPNGVVIAASNAQLLNRTIPSDYLPGGEQPRRRPYLSSEIPGYGPAIIAAAPIRSQVNGYSVALVRARPGIDQMASGITRRVSSVVIFLIIAALMITAWLSRDLVKRLNATGQAARALADGDLTQRVPTAGRDEITELAGHFNHMAERIQALVDGLRRSEKARKDLLVTVSHELRTPMTSIAGFAEALRDGVVQGDERKQRYYQIIASEAARLNRLVNDLFDVARLDAGQADLSLRAIAAADWLLDFAEASRITAEAEGMKLDLEVTPEAERARIYGDRDRLNQVLTNLVSNALRFSPRSGTVRLAARLDGEDLVVSVADQGPGLTAADAGRVFDRFWQGPEQGRGHKGAGLGLAIVKSLVEAHGGTVGVDSQPGEGSTFWLRLKQMQS